MYVRRYEYAPERICMRVYVCMYARTQVRMYVCMHVRICM